MDFLKERRLWEDGGKGCDLLRGPRKSGGSGEQAECLSAQLLSHMNMLMGASEIKRNCKLVNKSDLSTRLAQSSSLNSLHCLLNGLFIATVEADRLLN